MTWENDFVQHILYTQNGIGTLHQSIKKERETIEFIPCSVFDWQKIFKWLDNEPSTYLRNSITISGLFSIISQARSIYDRKSLCHILQQRMEVTEHRGWHGDTVLCPSIRALSISSFLFSHCSDDPEEDWEGHRGDLSACLHYICSDAQCFLTLWDTMDCSLPGSSVHGIFQVRILECVATSFSRGSSPPRDWGWVSRIAGKFFTPLLLLKDVEIFLQGNHPFLSLNSRISKEWREKVVERRRGQKDDRVRENRNKKHVFHLFSSDYYALESW